MERPVRAHPYKQKLLCILRSSPAIIPLESTMPQADPRTDPRVSFMDLVEEEVVLEEVETSQDAIEKEERMSN